MKRHGRIRRGRYCLGRFWNNSLPFRSFYVFFLFFGIVGAIMIVVAWGPLRGFELSHRLQELRAEETILTDQNDCLRMEIEKLKSRERIEHLASVKLRLHRPTSEQLVVIAPGPGEEEAVEGASIHLARFTSNVKTKFARLFGPPSALVGVR